MNRVLIADDSLIVRLGLQALIGSQLDLEVCGCASDGAEAVALAATSSPVIVLMDVGMPVLDGIAATRRLMELDPRPLVVMLTGSSEPAVIQAANDAGAVGYVLKDAGPDALLDAIHAVLRGDKPVPGDSSGRTR